MTANIQDKLDDTEENDWENFAGWVGDIPQGYDWYLWDSDAGEFIGVDDDDLESYKDDFFDRTEEEELFDDEEEEYDEGYEDEDEECRIAPPAARTASDIRVAAADPIVGVVVVAHNTPPKTSNGLVAAEKSGRQILS